MILKRSLINRQNNDAKLAVVPSVIQYSQALAFPKVGILIFQRTSNRNTTLSFSQSAFRLALVCPMASA